MNSVNSAISFQLTNFQNNPAGILQKRKMEDTSNSKRGLISTRGKFSSWDDFIETANQYFTQVKKWEGAGITHGDFFLGQPRDPPKPEMLSALWGSLQKGSKPDTPTDYFGYNFLQKEAQQAIPEMIRNRDYTG